MKAIACALVALALVAGMVFAEEQPPAPPTDLHQVDHENLDAREESGCFISSIQG